METKKWSALPFAVRAQSWSDNEDCWNTWTASHTVANWSLFSQIKPVLYQAAKLSFPFYCFHNICWYEPSWGAWIGTVCWWRKVEEKTEKPSSRWDLNQWPLHRVFPCWHHIALSVKLSIKVFTDWTNDILETSSNNLSNFITLYCYALVCTVRSLMRLASRCSNVWFGCTSKNREKTIVWWQHRGRRWNSCWLIHFSENLRISHEVLKLKKS